MKAVERVLQVLQQILELGKCPVELAVGPEDYDEIWEEAMSLEDKSWVVMRYPPRPRDMTATLVLNGPTGPVTLVRGGPAS